MEIIANSEAVDRVLQALAEQLAAIGEPYELVVVGGSGLLVLEAIERATRDVDLVALRSGTTLTSPDPLPDPLRESRDRVARDFSLPFNWLNAGPASLLDFELPAGFLDRVESRRYGDHLMVHFASRLDQIHSSSMPRSMRVQASIHRTWRHWRRRQRSCCGRRVGRVPTTPRRDSR
jgi:hypothetical protein